MENVIAAAAVAVIIIAIVFYLIHSKKKGNACPGCACGGQCSGRCGHCKKKRTK